MVRKARPTRPRVPRSAQRWHKEVNKYLARRIELADERDDLLEVSYLKTCQLALAMLEQLGVFFGPSDQIVAERALYILAGYQSIDKVCDQTLSVSRLIPFLRFPYRPLRRLRRQPSNSCAKTKVTRSSELHRAEHLLRASDRRF